MIKINATNIRKIEIDSIERYVSHYTPWIPQQAIYSKQILSETPTVFQNVERSIFMKEVKTKK